MVIYSYMIDQIVIHVMGGHGGNGVVSGRHEKFVPAGGPDGGNGGDGGSVYLVGDSNVRGLMQFRRVNRYVGGAGGYGSGSLRHGKQGAEVQVRVPVGTQVWQRDVCVADVIEQDQRVLAASGGKGGRGNAAFVSSTLRFPLLAEEGEVGEGSALRLEMKVLADIGIIGAPNVGKSSLLAAVTAARPKIADYPFTTTEPVLGVVERWNQQFLMVDIPGLIEGAHAGLGLGHDFLRHIERTVVLVHVLDGSADPAAQYARVNNELRQFSETLTRKPQIVAVNKVDLPGVGERVSELERELKGHVTPIYAVSAAARTGLDELLDGVLETLNRTREEQAVAPITPDDPELPVLRPRGRGTRPAVHRKDGAYVVSDPAATRVAGMIDGRDWSARMQFYGHLKRLGVVKALEEAGIVPGDTVHIGKLECEWE